jgi:hypothetical protein
MLKALIAVLTINTVCFATAAKPWVIDNMQAQQQAAKQSSTLSFKKHVMEHSSATYSSIVKRYANKRSANSIIFEQAADWNSWAPIKNVGPTNLRNAPVFLSKGDNDYWLFGQYGEVNKKQNFTAKNVVLADYNIPLQSTPFTNQYDAPGGLRESLGGYHAWQSKDMLNWVHHGPVTELFAKWVTSAEYVDGKTYLYYDYPNDQDPHLYIDSDLTDGAPGENIGMVFKDPSHGSDAAFFRESDGSMHVIYEDWTPIDASKHSWDSPLAGHAVSKNGVDDYEAMPPAIDLRTTPTGKIKQHKHPHWKQHPDWDTNIAEYEEHIPVQDAFGDWAMIKVGSQYYLFGDYDHAEHSQSNGHSDKEASANMSIARFTTASLDNEFKLVGDFGKTGHPDPDVGFAEGKFYLITQTKDFVSTGPWVDSVTARVGVDIDNDGKIDHWTAWQKVTEKYQQKTGFVKHVERTPATLNLSSLPAGYGFSFEYRTQADPNGVTPTLNKVSMSFN